MKNEQGCSSPIEPVVSVPTYKSNATKEQQAGKLKFLSFQLSMIKEQAGWGMTADKTTVKCGCHKKVKLIHAYRCLYCQVWYCKTCAEEHFGAKAI